MRKQAADEAVLNILVVDDHQFQRRLIAETLRAAGRVEIHYADNVDQAVGMLKFVQPNIIIADWEIGGGEGLSLVQRIRAGDGGETARKTPIIIVTSKNTASTVQKARNSGIDEFVLRPFSTETMLKRVMEVRARQRDFIESTRYVGPCRRRSRRGEGYEGPRRRLFESGDKNADAPDVQIRKGLARMYVERINGQLAALKPNDAEAKRELCLTCGQLSALAGDMSDRLLMSATSSLFNYIKGVGAEAQFNTDVAKAHLDAILQLAELPNHQIELRQTVTQQLSVMVTKKLRQAGEAA